jgi:sugar/nucleoside kinase (ribokinase family)
VVGAAARDIDATDRRGWRLGGGVSYGALLAGRLGVRTAALIGLDAPARRAPELDLMRLAGVDLEVVPLERGPLFDNIETPSGRRQVSQGVSDPVPPERLPDGWRAAQAFLLAPVAGELDETWAAVLPAESLVALSWQGLLRELAVGLPVVHLPARPHPLVTRADLIGVSREDLRAAGAELLAELIARTGQEAALTAGEQGALHLRRAESGFRMRRVPAVPARRVGDLVGAGDAFLTTWLAALLRDGPFGAQPATTPRALYLAAVVASLTTEGRGLPGLPDAAATRQRLGELARAPARPPASG